MPKDTRITTQHPQGKQGVNILKRRYEIIKDFILYTINEHTQISYKKLSALAVEQLSATFDGKVVWYVVSVKLDLEARNIIERVPKTSPHEIRMKIK